MANSFLALLSTPLCVPHLHSGPAVKPQLQIRAGAEKWMDTRKIMNRYRKLVIARSILRCADAVAMLVMNGYGTLTNQNIETRGQYYSTLWYPPTLPNHATGELRYR